MTSGCVRSYAVRMTNESSTPVTVALSQYHSKAFNGERPLSFTDDLKQKTQSVSLLPREGATVKFNDAGGGFWVRWCVLEPPRRGEPCEVIDLGYDRLEIEIK